MKYSLLFVATLCCFLSACSGCSRSGRIKRHLGSDTVAAGGARDGHGASGERSAAGGDRPSAGGDKSAGGPSTTVDRPLGEKTVVKMAKQNGVYQIPVTINGSEMYFIFDTGAGMISISTVEATFLYKQGKLTDDDIIGKANFLDAQGNISEDVLIRLKEVTIGNRKIRNIDASVVGNAKAPLLFGQSALEKFGKISIDYGKGEISFE